ncbi:MAG: hypothetical protein MAGBODY4_01517 [Candidatus Marinimicrobia bacterium]|nr:hypothetical protein [Candidatus Neomarinimicrobiota bacterium]
MRHHTYLGLSLAFLFALPVLLSTCSNQTEKQIEKVTRKAKDKIGQLSRKAKPLKEDVKQLTDDQITKLWAVEYKTVKLSDEEISGIDSVINGYGANRWDCYHVERTGNTWYFFFKRRKKSALRNLPYIEYLEWLSMEDSVASDTSGSK